MKGLPGWLSGGESTYQRRGHRFDPQSGKILRAVGQLSPCTAASEPGLQSPGASTILSPHILEAVLPDKRSEKPAHGNQREAPVSHNQRKGLRSNEDPAQPKINKYIKLLFKKEELIQIQSRSRMINVMVDRCYSQEKSEDCQLFQVTTHLQFHSKENFIRNLQYLFFQNNSRRVISSFKSP